MTRSIFDIWAEAVQKSLAATGAVVSSATDHALLLGDARETLVRDILTSFLPSALVVGCGQIVDGRGNYSRQIDVIIYDSHFPVFRTRGTQDVYPLEGVLGTIEVKSTLNAATLREAASNSASVKMLCPSFEPESVRAWCAKNGLDPTLSDEPHPSLIDETARNRLLSHLLPPTYVFGFGGYKRNLQSLRDTMNSWGQANRAKIRIWPDAIITEGCVALRDDGRPYKSQDGPKGGYIARVERSPLRYLLKGLHYRLMKRIGASVMVDDESQIRMPALAQFEIGMTGGWERWDVQLKDVRDSD